MCPSSVTLRSRKRAGADRGPQTPLPVTISMSPPTRASPLQPRLGCSSSLGVRARGWRGEGSASAGGGVFVATRRRWQRCADCWYARWDADAGSAAGTWPSAAAATLPGLTLCTRRICGPTPLGLLFLALQLLLRLAQAPKGSAGRARAGGLRQERGEEGASGDLVLLRQTWTRSPVGGTSSLLAGEVGT
jgi:hypothetical protein